MRATYVLEMLGGGGEEEDPAFSAEEPPEESSVPLAASDERGAASSSVGRLDDLSSSFKGSTVNKALSACTLALNAATAALLFPSTTTPDVLASSLCVTLSAPGSRPRPRSAHPTTHSVALLSCAWVGSRAGLLTTR